MKELEKYRHQISVDVRYDDLDTMGHVNNKMYLSYLEEARIGYHEDVFLFDKKTLAFHVVVGRIDIKYIAPILYGDQVTLYTRCSRIGKRSFDMETLIIRFNKGKQQLCAQCTVTMVSIDVKTGKSMDNPLSEIEAMRKYEKTEPVNS